MAAQTRTVLLCLAALCLPALANVPRAALLSEKPHQAVAGFVLASHWGAAAAKALSAPGLCGCLYDSGRRSRSTGKERDAETGLDYMDFRYYGGAQGRFMSPDPWIASARLENPQSWNRYVYALNNPLRYVDPLGLYPAPAFSCEGNQTACLNGDQQRILTNSSVERTVDGKKQRLSGAALWNSLSETEKNAFTNVTDKLASIQLKDGSALASVESVDNIKGDRIYANVLEGTASALRGSPMFTQQSAGDHAPYNLISFKNNTDVQGNIQFSFNSTLRGADIDIDLGNMASRNPLGPIIHTIEVTLNKTTGTTTNQDAVRRLLLANPAVQTITPSPVSSWNRSK